LSSEASEVAESQAEVEESQGSQVAEEGGADAYEEVKRVEAKLPKDKYEALKVCAREQGLSVGPFMRQIAVEWLEQNTRQDATNVEISGKDAVKLEKDQGKLEQAIISCLIGVDPEDYHEKGEAKAVLAAQGTCFRKLGGLFIQAGGHDNVPYNLAAVKPEFVKLVMREAQTDPRVKTRLPRFLRYLLLMNEHHRRDSKVTSYKVRIPPPPVEEKPSVVDQFVDEVMQPPEPEPPSTEEVVYVPPVPAPEAKAASTPRPNRKKERDLKVEREAFAEGDWEDW